MWTTNVSSTALTGSPVASISMPLLSIRTCPCGSRRTAKMAAGSAAMARWTSMRSVIGPSSRDRRCPSCPGDPAELDRRRQVGMGGHDPDREAVASRPVAAEATPQAQVARRRAPDGLHRDERRVVDLVGLADRAVHQLHGDVVGAQLAERDLGLDHAL